MQRTTVRWYLTFLCMTLAAVAPLEAQEEFLLRGYVEHQFSVSRSGNQWRMLDYDRFRAELDARAGRGTRASAAVVYQLYRGDTRVDVRDLLPDDLAALLDSTVVELDDQHFLNHAYFTLTPGRFQLTAGKQYLTWGAAWAFNPTELFRPKNLFEPTYEREGIGAVSAQLALGSLSDVLVALVPDGGFDESGKVVRARHHVAGFDVSALVAELHETPLGGGLGVTGLAPERRVTVGGDVSGEMLGLGIWMEATWSDRAEERWVETTVGGNYTLGDGTLLLVEGYYNGRGEWGRPYSAQLWLRRLSGDLRSLGKGMAYAVVTRPVGDLWNVGMSILSNLGDGSLVFIPSVSYAFAENVDLLFNGAVYAGGNGAEFGSGNHGGFLRGRVYF